MVASALDDSIQNLVWVRDVKRGQMLEAEIEAEAKHLRPRSRSRGQPWGRGQLNEAAAKTETKDYKYVKVLERKQRIILNNKLYNRYSLLRFSSPNCSESNKIEIPNYYTKTRLETGF